LNTQVELANNDLVTFTWNCDKKRVGRHDGIDELTFVWDNENIVAEVDGGVAEAQYTYSLQPYGNLVSQHRESESSFYHFDALGNTRLLSDSAQVEADTYDYDAWGESLSSTGVDSNPYRYGGEKGYYWDEKLETYQLRRRTYDAQMGRFLSEDPLGFAGGDTNLYRYAENDPVNQSDPSGLSPFLCADRHRDGSVVSVGSTPCGGVNPGCGDEARCSKVIGTVSVQHEMQGDKSCVQLSSSVQGMGLNFGDKQGNCHSFEAIGAKIADGSFDPCAGSASEMGSDANQSLPETRDEGGHSSSGESSGQSGGSKGPVSVKGAIIGGLIGGVPGALIGAIGVEGLCNTPLLPKDFCAVVRKIGADPLKLSFQMVKCLFRGFLEGIGKLTSWATENPCELVIEVLVGLPGGLCQLDWKKTKPSAVVGLIDSWGRTFGLYLLDEAQNLLGTIVGVALWLADRLWETGGKLDVEGALLDVVNKVWSAVTGIGAQVIELIRGTAVMIWGAFVGAMLKLAAGAAGSFVGVGVVAMAVKLYNFVSAVIDQLENLGHLLDIAGKVISQCSQQCPDVIGAIAELFLEGFKLALKAIGKAVIVGLFGFAIARLFCRLAATLYRVIMAIICFIANLLRSVLALFKEWLKRIGRPTETAKPTCTVKKGSCPPKPPKCNASGSKAIVFGTIFVWRVVYPLGAGLGGESARGSVACSSWERPT
jgi:RHS repeat-associated protein